MRMVSVWVVGATAILLGGCGGSVPKNLGVANGRLAPCQASPNCVCSMDLGSSAFIEPFGYDTDWMAAGQALRQVVKEQTDATIILDEPEYLHVEFRSRLLGFVDDVEFYFPPKLQQVEVRSASRLGWWDMGVNRKRIERLRQLFLAAIGR
ncbi:DUF1499 domain-containing protein [Desulfopila aestuarii]|uniref:Uncharacterized conserved protein, DUF1499 family n=1 Tax=Desulfopila aestuarii DSM 18488 TaxID=1121416 RepID=A0A1M7YA42_9BACT|nr:DUF1499 domain-containing protein [Desulfopila aestuarii]SHO49502.1 Uncharacterized conserved protein, DUF1499 family [Desulfopila aestuarii DSM 18488]